MKYEKKRTPNNHNEWNVIKRTHKRIEWKWLTCKRAHPIGSAKKQWKWNGVHFFKAQLYLPLRSHPLYYVGIVHSLLRLHERQSNSICTQFNDLCYRVLCIFVQLFGLLFFFPFHGIIFPNNQIGMLQTSLVCHSIHFVRFNANTFFVHLEMALQ